MNYFIVPVCKNDTTKYIYYTMNVKKGDLVACYITNTDQWEALLNWGLVLDVHDSLEDILVLDNEGYQRWWPKRRWRLLSPKKGEKFVDIKGRLA